MPGEVFLDNDIVIKSCQFAITEDLLNVLRPIGSPHILSVSAYVIPKRVATKKGLSNLQRITDDCAALLAELIKVEPTDEEINLAADFEDRARAMQLELDVGESQLLAILISRQSQLMVTGDKRAISAAEVFIEARPECRHKIACFEQILLEILRYKDAGALRTNICAEAVADKAISICFSCQQACVRQDDVFEGLKSYIGAVRGKAAESLVISDDLSALSS